MTDKDLLTLAEIRSALGINEKVMLGELLEKTRKIRCNAERYEKVRKMMPSDFSRLRMKSLMRNISFDEIVDALATTREKEENT